MTFPPDIIERIRADFKDSNAATELLVSAISKADYLKTDRVIRCIIYLSEGDLTKLSKYITTAINDTRDVMLWAEYDKFEFDSKTKRIRDFNKTFGDCETDVRE